MSRNGGRATFSSGLLDGLAWAWEQTGCRLLHKVWIFFMNEWLSDIRWILAGATGLQHYWKSPTGETLQYDFYPRSEDWNAYEAIPAPRRWYIHYPYLYIILYWSMTTWDVILLLFFMPKSIKSSRTFFYCEGLHAWQKLLECRTEGHPFRHSVYWSITDMKTPNHGDDFSKSGRSMVNAEFILVSK